MTLLEMEKKVWDNMYLGMTFTSNEMAWICWPDYAAIDPRRPKMHPYAAQVSIVLKHFPNVKRDKKTKRYTVFSSR